MNTDQIKGNWKQLVGKAKEKWGRLTDNDWQIVEGKRDQLVGKVQERYGIAREEAERQVADFERTHETAPPPIVPASSLGDALSHGWRLPWPKWSKGNRLCAGVDAIEAILVLRLLTPTPGGHVHIMFYKCLRASSTSLIDKLPAPIAPRAYKVSRANPVVTEAR